MIKVTFHICEGMMVLGSRLLFGEKMLRTKFFTIYTKYSRWIKVLKENTTGLASHFYHSSHFHFKNYLRKHLILLPLA